MESLQINVQRTKAQLCDEIDLVRKVANEKFAFQADLLSDINFLLDYAVDVTQFVDQYDYKDVQGNGFRSAVQLGLNLVRYGAQHADNDIGFIAEFARAVEQFKYGVGFLKQLRMDTEKMATGDGKCSLETGDAFLMSTAFFRYINHCDTESFYGKLIKFPFSSELTASPAITAIKAFCLLLARSPRHSYDILFGSKDISKTFSYVVKNIDVYRLKLVDNVFAQSLMHEHLVPYLVNGFKPKTKKTIAVPRQSRWLIVCDVKLQAVEIEDNCNNNRSLPTYNQDLVSCRYLNEPDPETGSPSPSGDLLIDIHGGGFCSSTARGHELYLRDWSRKLPGVGLLAIDYSLAPKCKFPVANQEVLDVYLWAISGHKDVKRVLGFQPTRIVLVGDSSGAMMCMSLTTMLNDIRKLDSSAVPIMPTAVVGVYPSFTCEAFMYPSMMMSASHNLITPAVLASFIEAYVPHRLQYGDNCSHFHDNDLILNGFFDYFKIFASFILGTRTRTVPWYKAGVEDTMKTYMAQDVKLMRHHYVSPIKYRHLADLADVKLVVIACATDPILDQAIIMARNWKGPVSVDIIENLGHGFLFCSSLGDVYQQASDVCVNRIKCAFTSASGTDQSI
ncbi:Hormone-sensitive lipase [Halotydeus destructor]|nr:Hormone-sensitive lipase [Halotydeus destructor]